MINRRSNRIRSAVSGVSRRVHHNHGSNSFSKSISSSRFKTMVFVDTFRLQLRDDGLNIDQEKTALGFDGPDPGSWDSINSW